MSAAALLLLLANSQPLDGAIDYDAWGGSWGDSWGNSWGPDAVAAVTGTITGTAGNGVKEIEIVLGGDTIIITLTSGTWVAAGAAFNAQRQAIINGAVSNDTAVFGWNNEVKDKEVVGAIVRTSDEILTWTLTARPTFAIPDSESITMTIPAAAIDGASLDVVATPVFSVFATGQHLNKPWMETVGQMMNP